MLIQIVSKHKLRKSGTTPLRCFQPQEYLQFSENKVTVNHIYESIPKAADILILHRVKLDNYTQKFIKYAKRMGAVVIYDIDDLLFSKLGEAYLSRIQRCQYERHIESENHFKAAMKLCDTVVVSVPYLANYVNKWHSDVRVMRNGLSREYLNTANNIFEKRRNAKSRKLVTIGYLSGSSTHDYDFKIVENALLRVLRKFENVKVMLVGPVSFSKKFLYFGERFLHIKWVEYNEYPRLFESIDINVIPLEVSQPFCQCKSELKYIESGACGVVNIASPTDVYAEIISNEFNGLLAGDNDNGWYDVLKDLINNPMKREIIGENGREFVIKNYSVSKRIIEWQKLLNDILATHGEGKRNSCFSVESLLLRLNLEQERMYRMSKSLVYKTISAFR